MDTVSRVMRCPCSDSTVGSSSVCVRFWAEQIEQNNSSQALTCAVSGSSGNTVHQLSMASRKANTNGTRGIRVSRNRHYSAPIILPMSVRLRRWRHTLTIVCLLNSHESSHKFCRYVLLRRSWLRTWSKRLIRLNCSSLRYLPSDQLPVAPDPVDCVRSLCSR